MSSNDLDETKIILDDSIESSPVLIIDDILGTRMIITDMLKEMGFTNFLEAENGKEALEKLKKTRAGIIISDNIMKDMTGLQLLDVIRNYPYLADIPFLMMSAQSDIDVFDASLKLGAVDYIVKPIGFEVLKNKIFRILKMQNLER